MHLINFLSLYLLSISVAIVYCTIQISALNRSTYTKPILYLGLAICIYILGYAMELNASASANILFWNRIEYFGIPFVAALWLTTGLQYTGCFALHKKILIPAIYGIPIITFILRFTNDLHHFYFISVDYVELFGTLFLVKQPGPWLFVQFAHSATMILVAMALLIYDSVKRADKQMGKLLLIIVASLIAVAGLCLPKLQPFALPLDYMALVLPITCMMFILVILRYDLLETKSIARSKAFDAGSDAVLLINRQNMVLDYNNSAKRLVEQLHIVLNNRSLKMIFGDMPNLLAALQKTEPAVVKLQIDGADRYYEITTENIAVHNSLRGWIKSIRDITERYRLDMELKKQATTDELSVLANRRAFMNTGREWVSRSELSGRTLYLLMMDLDHFKDINDQYGHLAGDFVIREFAQILESHFRANSLVARLGGEEFAVLLEGLSDDELMRLQNSFLAMTERHRYSYLDSLLHVTVSIGTTKKQPGQTLENMMGKADKALYQSKTRGRNCSTMQ